MPVSAGARKRSAGSSLPSNATVINGREVWLRMLVQPEEQHRARYMSEGSRGAVKGRAGKSHASVQVGSPAHKL